MSINLEKYNFTKQIEIQYANLLFNLNNIDYNTWRDEMERINVRYN